MRRLVTQLVELLKFDGATGFVFLTVQVTFFVNDHEIMLKIMRTSLWLSAVVQGVNYINVAH
jgi:hypothetical protein